MSCVHVFPAESVGVGFDVESQANETISRLAPVVLIAGVVTALIFTPDV